MSLTISRDETVSWIKYIRDICGISLDESKSYLFETRFVTLFRETGATGFSELLNKAKTDMTGAIRRKVIDAITTNETSFFRDSAPFDLIRHKLVPDLIDRRNRAGTRAPVVIRIWSAASSTGQEVYSTAISIAELVGGDMRNYDVRILGTDISDRVVAQASKGHFSALDIERGMSPALLSKYFIREGDYYKVKDEIRAMATFRTMNLLEPFSFPTPFDFVFCRNVAIYFSEADKIRLFRNIGKVLEKEGSLIIGSTETLGGSLPEFESKRHVRAVYYQLKK